MTTDRRADPLVTGVRHLKIWVSDLARSRTWFEQVLGLQHRISLEDSDGVVRGMSFAVPHVGFEIALREDPGRAAALHDADPFALATTRAGLDRWVDHLDALGVWHSTIITGLPPRLPRPRRHADTSVRRRPRDHRAGRRPRPCMT